MSLEKSNMPLSAKQISVMDSNDKFDYNHIAQRGLVWERSRKSALIESMILGYPIPQIYCRRDRDEFTPSKKGTSRYVVMDGKQRLTTIASFIRDEWALSTLNPVPYVSMSGEASEAILSRKTFSELPEEIQDTIKDTSISFICFDDITESEEMELFRRLNSGKPLRPREKMISSCKDLKTMMNIGDHIYFTKMFDAAQLEKKDHIVVIARLWAMMNTDIKKLSLGTRRINSIVSSMKITDDQSMILYNVLDLANGVYNTLQDIDLNKAEELLEDIHLVSFAPFFQRAIDENRDDLNLLAQWFENFFGPDDEETVDEYFTASIREEAWKPENIQIRSSILQKSYEEFFAEN